MNTELIEDHSSRKFCCVSVHICFQYYISRFFVTLNCSSQGTPSLALSTQMPIRTLHLEATSFNKSNYKTDSTKTRLAQ
jgi:hypothetical protein